MEVLVETDLDATGGCVVGVLGLEIGVAEEGRKFAVLKARETGSSRIPQMWITGE